LNVTIKDMLEAGAHFGHQTRRWNPKMKPYIYKEQNGIYIIDLRSTMEQMQKAYDAAEALAATGKTFIFVGTKRQAKESVQEDAARSGMYYVNERWLGGILTNFKTIKQSMQRLEDLEAMEKDGRINQLSKKERLHVDKQKAKLIKVLSGIRGMTAIPACLIVIDTKKEAIAVQEARKLGLTIVGLVDTNADPDEVDIAVPANDDAIRSIKLFTRVLADAIVEGRGKFLKDKEFLDDKGRKGERTDRPDRPERAEKPEKPAAAPEAKDAKRSPSKRTGADVDIEEQEPGR
jgi:small subunit ribosomal protein S2